MAKSETGETIQQVREALAEFVSKETELAKAEVIPAAKQAGIGSGMFAGAGAFAFHALWMIIIAIALGIAWLLNSLTVIGPWGSGAIAFLITAVFSLLVAFILVKLGQSKFRQVSMPEATIAEAKATFTAISDTVTGHTAADRELAAKNTIEGVVEHR
ncbi:MAG: phage holin family protein [Propionibacteriaceae bacterium]|nr:phage holin family protein [Propionibacteriaceae bacterium]